MISREAEIQHDERQSLWTQSKDFSGKRSVVTEVAAMAANPIKQVQT